MNVSEILREGQDSLETAKNNAETADTPLARTIYFSSESLFFGLFAVVAQLRNLEQELSEIKAWLQAK